MDALCRHLELLLHALEELAHLVAGLLDGVGAELAVLERRQVVFAVLAKSILVSRPSLPGVTRMTVALTPLAPISIPPCRLSWACTAEALLQAAGEQAKAEQGAVFRKRVHRFGSSFLGTEKAEGHGRVAFSLT